MSMFEKDNWRFIECYWGIGIYRNDRTGKYTIAGRNCDDFEELDDARDEIDCIAQLSTSRTI